MAACGITAGEVDVKRSRSELELELTRRTNPHDTKASTMARGVRAPVCCSLPLSLCVCGIPGILWKHWASFCPLILSSHNNNNPNSNPHGTIPWLYFRFSLWLFSLKEVHNTSCGAYLECASLMHIYTLGFLRHTTRSQTSARSVLRIEQTLTRKAQK